MTSVFYRASLTGLLAGLAWVLPLPGQTTPAPPDAPDNPTAYTALRAVSKSLGREALDRVVEVVGRDGAPQPRLWKIVLKEGDGSREVDVEDGKITAQRPLTRPPADATPVRLADLNLDSSGAFDATDAQARKVKLRFDSLNYALRVSDTTGKPVWQIELINKEGTGVGSIRVAAHDGTVLSTDGRLASNPPPVATPRPSPRPVVSTPPPRVVAATPRPTSTPRPVVTTTVTTTATVERTPPPVVASEPAVTDSDNVYGQPAPPEEGGLFTRTGRTLDHTGQRVESTLRNATVKVQRFFTFHRDSDPEAPPGPAAPSNRPD